MKNFADVNADVKNTGVHQPLKAKTKNFGMQMQLTT